MRFFFITLVLMLNISQPVVAASNMDTSTLRKLQQEAPFLSYEPSGNVDVSAKIDLDQRSLVARLALGTESGMDEAQKVYSQGTFYNVRASLKITALSTDIQALSAVSGLPIDGGSKAVRGFVVKDAKVGDTELMVQYDVGTSCFVNPDPNTTSCFARSGTIDVEGEETSSTFLYTYKPLQDTFSLSLQSLSNGGSGSLMYETYVGYSGAYDYANQWISAAFSGTSTKFPKSEVDVDFGNFGLEGRAASIQWGTVGLNVWGHVSKKLENAAKTCIGAQALRDWDEAVATYTGSVAKTTGNNGYLLYTLAQVECKKFGTCIKDKGDVAAVNSKIFENFVQGKEHLTQSKCRDAKKNVERIQALMTVPLIQGVLHTVYAMDNGDDYQEITQGQAAAFAASILPTLHACKEASAVTVYTDLAPGKGTTASFEVIKFALERTYACLGITCADVGGLVDPNPAGNGYYKNAEPCSGERPTSPSSPMISSKDGGNDVGLAIGLILGIGILLAVVIVMLVYQRQRRKEFDTATGSSKAGIVKTSDLKLNESRNAEGGEIA